MAKTRRARIDAENGHRRITRLRLQIIEAETQGFPTFFFGHNLALVRLSTTAGRVTRRYYYGRGHNGGRRGVWRGLSPPSKGLDLTPIVVIYYIMASSQRENAEKGENGAAFPHFPAFSAVLPAAAGPSPDEPYGPRGSGAVRGKHRPSACRRVAT